MVVVNYIYDMVVDTQFHKFHGRPFARVLYLLMKDIGRRFNTVYDGRCISHPTGPIFYDGYLESWHSGGAKKVALGHVPPRAFRRV